MDSIKKQVRYSEETEDPAARQPMMLTERHRRCMRYAIRRASEAPHQMFRLGCAIAKGGVVISSGVNNMRKTHPKAINYDYPYLHAELAAMLGVDEEDLRGSVVYVARKRATGIGLAKPCSFCLAKMRQFGIRGVFYTTYGGVEYLDLRK